MNNLRMIKYQPELNEITGSITATILMAQLEYWFEKMKGNAFYKFLAPCEDECYKVGDSWCEELSFTKPEFRTAFGRIGKVYKSKKAYLNSKDKFEGKLYLSYYDRIRRRTYYLRNHQLLNQLLGNLEEKESTNVESPSPITEDYTKDLLQKNTTEDDDKEMATHQRIIDMYHEICTDLPKVKILTPLRRRAIDQLVATIGGSLRAIRKLFEKAHASDFLNGRVASQKWQAAFDWIIDQVKAKAILQGNYDNWGTQTRDSVSKQTHNKFTTTYSHNWDYDKLDELAYEYLLCYNK